MGWRAPGSAEARAPHAAPKTVLFPNNDFVNLLGTRHFVSCVNVLRGSELKSLALRAEDHISHPEESAQSPSHGRGESSPVADAFSPQARACVGQV